MFDTRVLMGLVSVFLVSTVLWLWNSNKDYKQDIKQEKLKVESLEAQIESVLNDSKELAELYLRVRVRSKNIRFDTLQETLRFEDTVLNSEPNSELRKWSEQTLPKEVKDVMSNVGKGGLHGKGLGREIKD